MPCVFHCNKYDIFCNKFRRETLSVRYSAIAEPPDWLRFPPTLMVGVVGSGAPLPEFIRNTDSTCSTPVIGVQYIFFIALKYFWLLNHLSLCIEDAVIADDNQLTVLNLFHNGTMLID